MARETRRGKQVKAGEVWVAARIPEAAKDELDAWAEEEDRSTSYMIRMLVLRALDQRRARKEANEKTTTTER